MVLVSYLKDEHDQLAMLENDLLYDTDLLHLELPSSMSMFLNFWDDNYSLALKIQKAINNKLTGKGKGFAVEDAQLLAPIPFAASCRSFVNTTTDNHPASCFLNHHSIQGAGSIMCMPDNFYQLNCTPHVAIVISKLGRNITAEEADEYIGGLMIMNVFKSDLSKDVAIATGPYFVTMDELAEFEMPKENHTGKTWNLKMQCSINNEPISEGNVNDMPFTFAELIERASYGATLHAGDIISYGLNKTSNQVLKEGDVIETEIEFLGALTNTIEKEDSDFSIIDKTP